MSSRSSALSLQSLRTCQSPCLDTFSLSIILLVHVHIRASVISCEKSEPVSHSLLVAGWMMSSPLTPTTPPQICPLMPLNVTSLGKRVFADIIKDLEVRSSWSIWVGLKSSDKWPYRRKAEGDERPEKGRPCEDGAKEIPWWSHG